jgi:hypothetical protein
MQVTKQENIVMRNRLLIALCILLTIAALAIGQESARADAADKDDQISVWIGAGYGSMEPWIPSYSAGASTVGGEFWPGENFYSVSSNVFHELSFVAVPLEGGLEFSKGKLYFRGEFNFEMLKVTRESRAHTMYHYEINQISNEESDQSTEEVDSNLMVLELVGGYNFGLVSIYAGVLNFSLDYEFSYPPYELSDVGFSGIGGGVAFAESISEKLIVKGSAAYYYNPAWSEAEATPLNSSGNYDEPGLLFKREQFYKSAMIFRAEVRFMITDTIFAGVGYNYLYLPDEYDINYTTAEVIAGGTSYHITLRDDLPLQHSSLLIKAGMRF